MNQDETFHSLAEAFNGDYEKAVKLLKSRREIIDDTLKKTEALLAAVSVHNWYDCTREMGIRACISSDTTLVSGANYHDDLRSADDGAEVQRVNGNFDADPGRGCLWLGLPSGTFNCRWHLHDGIEEEVRLRLSVFAVIFAQVRPHCCLTNILH